MEYTAPCVTFIDLNDSFRPSGTMSHSSDAASCLIEISDV